jgi:tetratricopeptide (TPR) repeat protein
MFELSTIHAESWLAAAYFSEMKGEKENALQFSERAILTNGHFSQAYLFRGVLLLEAGRPEHALVSFTASCKITKTLDAYIGIAESYCQMCRKGAIKYKEALTTAKTIIKLYPNNRKAYTLLGQVFALRPEGKEQAKKAYQKALSFDPHSVMAIFGLVDLLVQESNFAVAIEK